MSTKKEQFAALEGYPKDGPEMPEREKVHREKNKHEPGTGRRDREKREGRGQSNWGNALDDQLADYHEEEVNEEDVNEAPQGEANGNKNFHGASKYFEDDDEEGENKKKEGKKVVKVPPGYGKVVKAGKDVEVVEVDDSNDPDRKLPKPQHKLEKKPKREHYNPEKKEAQHEEEEDKDENVKKGKKPRDQQFHGVQHNREGHKQQPPQKQGP